MDDGAGPQNAKSNAPLGVESLLRTRACVCVFVFVFVCARTRPHTQRRGVSWHKKKKGVVGDKNQFKVYSLHPIGKA